MSKQLCSNGHCLGICCQCTYHKENGFLVQCTYENNPALIGAINNEVSPFFGCSNFICELLVAEYEELKLENATLELENEAEKLFHELIEHSLK